MVLEQRRLTMQAGIAAVLAALMLSLTGCGNFFVYPGSLNGGTTNSGDYAYVSNSTTGSTYLNGYVLSSGLLVASTSSPYSISVTPSALAVTPSNGLLYIASYANGGIYAWAIGSGGVLTAENSGASVAGLNPLSIDISPDGQWLFALDGVTSTISEYGINNSNGTLTLVNQITYAATNGTTARPYQIRVAPTGNYVVAAVGDAGDIIFPFTTSTGTLGNSYGTSYGIATANPPLGADFTVTIDGSNNLYVGRTSGSVVGVSVYQLGASAGTLVAGSPFTTGSAPMSLTLSSGYSYLYTGNTTDTSLANNTGTLSEFSESSGGLTFLQTIAAPNLVASVGRDNSGKYVLAAGYNTTGGLEMYSIGSTGALSVVSNAPTAAYNSSAVVPAVMALTH